MYVTVIHISVLHTKLILLEKGRCEEMEKAEVEIEYETVQVRVPKAVMDLLRMFMEDVEDYLTTVIVHNVASDLEADFRYDGAIVDYWRIVDRFNLKKSLNFTMQYICQQNPQKSHSGPRRGPFTMQYICQQNAKTLHFPLPASHFSGFPPQCSIFM